MKEPLEGTMSEKEWRGMGGEKEKYTKKGRMRCCREEEIRARKNILCCIKLRALERRNVLLMNLISPFLSRIVFAFQLLISDRDTHFLFIQTVIKIFINISCEPHILRDELCNQRMHYIVLRLIIDKYISICNIFLPLKNFQTRFRLWSI